MPSNPKPDDRPPKPVPTPPPPPPGFRRSNVRALHDDSEMPFGKYRGQRLGEVPDHYWRWFLDQDWCGQYPDLVDYANQIVED
jgi:uncharacterized protein (DUF3820 family)